MAETVPTLDNRDPRIDKVLGFFIGKGLLWTNQPIKPYHGKILIEDALWVAENIEPRVYEVLPAAMLHFPKTFIGKNKIPPDLEQLLLHIQKGRRPKYLEISEWKGIPLKNILKWTNKPLKDHRTKTTQEIKINKTFRLSPKVVEALERMSKAKHVTQTEFIETLIISSR